MGTCISKQPSNNDHLVELIDNDNDDIPSTNISLTNSVDFDIITLILGYIHQFENEENKFVSRDVIQLIILFCNIYSLSLSTQTFNIGSKIDFCDVGFTKNVVSWLNATVIDKKEANCKMPKEYEKYIKEGYDNTDMKESEVFNKYALIIHLDHFPLEWIDYYRVIFLSDKSKIQELFCVCFGECKKTNIHRIAPYNTKSNGGGILDQDYPIYGIPQFKDIIGLTNLVENISSINSLLQCLYYVYINYGQFEQFMYKNNQGMIRDLLTLFCFMNSNEYKVVGTYRFYNNLKNKYKMKLSTNGIAQIDQFLKWFLSGLFMDINESNISDLICMNFATKYKYEQYEERDEWKDESQIITPYLSIPIESLLRNNKKTFYIYNLNIDNHTLSHYTFKYNQSMRLIDIKNAICKLHQIKDKELIYYFFYNKNHRNFIIHYDNISKLDYTKIDNDKVNGFIILDKVPLNIKSTTCLFSVCISSELRSNLCSAYPFPIIIDSSNKEITGKMIHDEVNRVLSEYCQFEETNDNNNISLNLYMINENEYYGENATNIIFNEKFKLKSEEITYDDSHNIIPNNDSNSKYIIMIKWKESTDILKSIEEENSNLDETLYSVELNFDDGYIVQELKEDDENDTQTSSLKEFINEYANNITMDYEQKDNDRVLKHLDILSLPNILIINFERQNNDHIYLEKISFSVNEMLNIMDYKYSLFGIICFIPNDEYYCYILENKSNEWYRIQDSLCYKSNPKEIEDEKFVCVLCYNKQ